MSTTNPTTEVTVRLANYTEIYTCAQVIAASFRDDPLFGEHIHPYRDQYPDDMVLFFYRAMLIDYFDWGMVFVVTAEKDKAGREIVTGVAVWHRYGETARQYGWALPTWDPRNLLHLLASLYSSLTSKLNPNRAISPTEHDIFLRADPFMQPIWAKTPPDRWYLHFLGVHPHHWNKGMGRKLVAWGLERARLEGVGAAVIAAHDKDRFYQACGFRECIGWAGEGEGNPFAAVKGGNVWWVGAPAEMRRGSEDTVKN